MSISGFGGKGGSGGSSSNATNLLSVSKTADYTVLAADTGKLFDNNGAAGQVIFTLPAAIARPASGLIYYFGFQVLAAQNLKIAMPSGFNVIYQGVDVSQAGLSGYLEASAIGQIVWLQNPKVNVWVAYGYGSAPWTIFV